MKKLVLLSSVILTLLFSYCNKSNNTEPIDNSPGDPFNPSAISIDSLTRNVSELSGETSANILGSNVTIRSRSQYFQDNDKAAEYLKARFKSLGLNVLDQRYSATGRNIIAIQPGQDKTNYFIICGHYDCCPDSALAPGADDDASGTSAVLEAARLISKLKPKYSVIYALFDEEERGQGSQYFADSAFTAGMKIKCLMNLDMIGYDENNSRLAALYQPQKFGSTQYADIIKSINTQYGYGINFVSDDSSSGAGDAWFFYYKGYATVDLGEKIRFSAHDPVHNFNKYYHTSSDRLDKFDRNYFEKMSKLAITSFAKMIGLECK